MQSKMIRAIQTSQEVAVDTETNSLNALQCRLKGVSISWLYKGRECSHYWNFNSDDMPTSEATAKWEKFRRDILEPLFNRKAVVLIFHNAAFDLKVFHARDLHPKTKRISDTMIMDFLLDENRFHDLKSCAQRHLGISNTKTHAATQKEMTGIVKAAQGRLKKTSAAVWNIYRDYHKGILKLKQIPKGYLRTTVAVLSAKLKKVDVEARVHQELGTRMVAKAQLKAQCLFNDYARKDALWTLRLHRYYLPLIQKEGFGQIYWGLYQNMLRQAIEMEIAGVKVDIPKLKVIRNLLQKKLKDIEKNIRKRFGKDFNPGSPLQVKQMLWVKRKLKPPTWIQTRDLGKDGLPGSGEDIIEWLVEQGHTFLKDLLIRRKLSKTLGTYILPLIEEAELDPQGRIHTSFSLIKRTARFGSSNPNLQNIPRWDTLKKYIPDCPSIRACFIAEKNCILLVTDMSQCDLRVMAHVTQDPAFLKSYRSWQCGQCKKKGETNKPYHTCPNCGEPEKDAKGKFQLGEDIHAQTGRATGLIAKLGEKDGRQEAKEVNFGATYLMGAPTLAKKLDIPIKEARVIIKAYHNTHIGIRHYANVLYQIVEKQGYFVMLNGQKRRFTKELKQIEMADRTVDEKGQSEHSKKRYALMRELLNNTGQGGTAVIMNTAMFLFWKRRKFLQKHNCRPLLQVHDELVFEVPAKNAGKVKTWIRDVMEESGKLTVPILASCNTGKTWETAK